MIGRRFFELAIDMCPATGEHDARSVASASFMRLQRVADDDSVVATDECVERRRTLVIADSMGNYAGRGDAPHLPRFVRVALELWPTGLIESDDGLRERMLE